MDTNDWEKEKIKWTLLFNSLTGQLEEQNKEINSLKSEIDFLDEKIKQRDEEWKQKIDKALKQCHGGGNGRRLLIQLKN